MKHYLSFGAGVNSVALHLLMIDEKYDFESVFINHGTDWPETYEYFGIFQSWLITNGHKPVTVIKPDFGCCSSLIEYCIQKTMLPHTRLRWCTSRFKVEPFQKYVTTPCFVHIGIDADESKRAKISSTNGMENRYLLLEHNIDRDGCKELIVSHGLPVPPKSGCFICPFQKKSQWIELRKNHPCLFSQVVALEKQNREYRITRGKKPYYLNNNKKPLSEIVDERQYNLFEQDNYPPCQCGL